MSHQRGYAGPLCRHAAASAGPTPAFGQSFTGTAGPRLHFACPRDPGGDATSCTLFLMVRGPTTNRHVRGPLAVPYKAAFYLRRRALARGVYRNVAALVGTWDAQSGALPPGIRSSLEPEVDGVRRAVDEPGATCPTVGLLSPLIPASAGSLHAHALSSSLCSYGQGWACQLHLAKACAPPTNCCGHTVASDLTQLPLPLNPRSTASTCPPGVRCGLRSHAYAT